MNFRDKWGWPIERIKGRPIVNFIRILLLTSWTRTWKQREYPYPDGPELWKENDVDKDPRDE